MMRKFVDRRFRRDGDSQSADFIGCVAFGRQAEFAEKYLRKGIKIALTGRIQTGSYTNRDGQKVYTTDVVVEDQEFAESNQTRAGQALLPCCAAFFADDSIRVQNKMRS